jgi:hypothetical protein
MIYLSQSDTTSALSFIFSTNPLFMIAINQTITSQL